MASELSPVPADLEFEATIRRLEVTEQVFDRYKLIRILGRGGMGVVWLAHDERLERDVALKFLPDEVGLDPEAEDEMKRETRRCLDLTHPNIVRIYDYIKDRRAAAISMEFIDGQSLSALKLERPRRVFEVDELGPWVLQACRALHYAHHEAGVIHRDLKPGNFMLTSRGQIKVGDFGIAQSVSDSFARTTLRRGTSGTIAYMSPQQMSGEPAAATDDVYALGATIYELLTGKPPFYSGNVPFQVRVMLAPSMRERRDEFEIRGAAIPPCWEVTIAACLSKSAAERPATMNELAERLGLAPATPAPVVSTRETPAQALLKRCGTRVLQGIQLAEKWKPSALSTRRAALAGSGAFLAALLMIVGRMTVASAPGGELRVDAGVPAHVHIAGYPDTATPARFADLRPGRYDVCVSADGFEPAHTSVTVRSGEHLNLGLINLERALGDWSLRAWPHHAHYVLNDNAGTGGCLVEGTTPDLAIRLPAGNYKLTVTAPNFPAVTQDIQVLAHCQNVESIDLIPGALGQVAGDPVAKVFAGQAPAASLDAQGVARLTLLQRQAFQRYLAEGCLDRASQQLEALRRLSAPVAVEVAALDQARAALESRVGVDAVRLIADRKFATAGNLLAGAADDLGPEAAARLASRFQPLLSAHASQVASALEGLNGLPADAALAKLRVLLAANPDDIRLRSAGVAWMAQLPPDLDDITRQVDAFRRVVQESRFTIRDPVALRAILLLESEQDGMKRLRRKSDEAKTALADANARLAHLQAQREEFADRRVGRPQSDPLSSTINFFGKVVTGHSVIHREPVFASSDAKVEAIRGADSQIAAVQASLPQLQAAADQAQADYERFAGTVPWPRT